nr:MAG TPA: hypothetical protein [Bacteriophage sp.]
MRNGNLWNRTRRGKDFLKKVVCEVTMKHEHEHEH